MPETLGILDSSPPDASADWECQDFPPQLRRLQSIWPTGPGAPRLVGGGTKEVYFDRWSGASGNPFELEIDFDVEDYVLSFPLASAHVVYNIGGRLITNNEIYPGEPFLNGPTESRSRKIYRSTFDIFRLSISTALLRERASCGEGRHRQSFPRLFGPHLNTDNVVQTLLMAAATSIGNHDNLYLEHIGAALADYLLGRYSELRPVRRSISPLSKWRLARVTEYIDENLVTDISLADLSTLVGVSRMHFAAQFKAATDITPHSYVLQRRVRAARPLLLDQRLSIQDVARAVGFRSSAHFADVFRRLVGESPRQWRNMIAQSRSESVRYRTSGFHG